MLNMGMRASDDMGFFLQAVPGAYFYLGGGHPEGPNHTPRFDFDEAVLELGAELLVRCVEALCRRT
jgi:amidohydrolase